MRALGFGLSTVVDLAMRRLFVGFPLGRPAGSYLVNALDAGPEHNSLKGALLSAPLFPLLRDKNDNVIIIISKQFVACTLNYILVY